MNSILPVQLHRTFSEDTRCTLSCDTIYNVALEVFAKSLPHILAFVEDFGGGEDFYDAHQFSMHLGFNGKKNPNTNKLYSKVTYLAAKTWSLGYQKIAVQYAYRDGSESHIFEEFFIQNLLVATDEESRFSLHALKAVIRHFKEKSDQEAVAYWERVLLERSEARQDYSTKSLKEEFAHDGCVYNACAEACAMNILKVDRFDVFGLNLCGLSQYTKNDLHTSLIFLKKAYEISPENVSYLRDVKDVLYKRAFLEGRRADYLEFLMLFEKERELKKDCPDVLRLLGLEHCLEVTRFQVELKVDLGLEYLRNDLLKDNQDALVGIANVLIRRGLLEEGRKCLDAIDPNRIQDTGDILKLTQLSLYLKSNHLQLAEGILAAYPHTRHPVFRTLEALHTLMIKKESMYPQILIQLETTMNGFPFYPQPYHLLSYMHKHGVGVAKDAPRAEEILRLAPPLVEESLASYIPTRRKRRKL